MIRLNSYRRLDYRFSYFATNDGREIDIVIDRPGLPTAWVEIKSKLETSDTDARHLLAIQSERPEDEFFCLSQDPAEARRGGVRFLPWKKGLSELGF